MWRAALGGSIAALLLSPAAQAAGDVLPLARQKTCMSCHALERKMVGPAYLDVAARYAGQPDAAARLAQSIMQGSRGNWGPVPMPASPRVTPAEAGQLARWILSLQP
ncbi:MAG: c-type cytochrome [Corticimicrobacter sp.]|uniref:c-type cytochrome n=1 Tax=Corticimicrobacter sp. TaxID=2678536 RepID=UPI0032DA0156